MRLDGFGDGSHFGQLPGTLLAAGKETLAGVHDRVAEGPEPGQVGLYRRMFPHARVHGRGPEHRGPRSQQYRAEEVAGQAVGGLA